MSKVKNFRRSIAFLLCLFMTCSMSISAFAVEGVDVCYSLNVQNGENATIDYGMGENNNLIETSNNRATISLPANETIAFRIGTLKADQTTTFRVDWSPIDSNLYIGLTNSLSSYTLRAVSGGSILYSETVTSTDTYYLVIMNPSASTSVTLGNVSYYS